MKKLIGLLFIFGFQYFLWADHSIPCAVSENISSYKKQYDDLVGYELDLKLWREQRENVVQGLSTLYVHGFGASPTTANEWVEIAGPSKIPGDVVTFRFADATDTNSPSFSHFNLGQKKDMYSLLVAFKAMQDLYGDAGWNTIGESRGAATIANTLALLNEPVDTWHKTFKALHINENERLALLESIKKGVVGLQVPVVTTAAGIHGNGKLVIKRYLKVDLPDIITSPLCGLLNHVLLPIRSRGNYLPWGEQALSSADRLPEGLKVLLHFQHNDKDVSNEYDQLFTEKLIKRLGRNNIWVVLAHDDGKEHDEVTWKALQDAHDRGVVKRILNRKTRAHTASSHTLLKKGVINALYKNNGGSYINDKDYLAQGEKILNSSHMIHNDDLDKYFKNYEVNNKI